MQQHVLKMFHEEVVNGKLLTLQESELWETASGAFGRAVVLV
jgi:hypothetical protein